MTCRILVRRPCCERIALASFLLVPGPLLAFAGDSTIVVPESRTAVNGGLSLQWVLFDSAVRMQTAISAIELGDIPDGSVITGLSFRRSGTSQQGNPWPARPLTWAQYQIGLSTSANPQGSLSLTFDQNTGADHVVVF